MMFTTRPREGRQLRANGDRHDSRSFLATRAELDGDVVDGESRRVGVGEDAGDERAQAAFVFARPAAPGPASR